MRAAAPHPGRASRFPALLLLLLQASRWRFWLYLAGPFLLGYTAGSPSLDSLRLPVFWALLLVFLPPANLLLYGINDLCDRDTDRLNPRKGTAELGLQQSQERALLIGVAVSAILLAGTLFWLPSPLARWLMLAFVALSVAYSAPPLRLKSRPVLDSASNILYAVPGFVGYGISSGRPVPWEAVIGAGLWTAAMHLYSAIPDIESDLKAGLATSATALGHHRALVACAVLWAGAAGMVTALRVLWPWCLLAWCYPVAPLVLLLRPPRDVARAYWYFPWVNAGLGMLAFFLLAGPRL